MLLKNWKKIEEEEEKGHFLSVVDASSIDFFPFCLFILFQCRSARLTVVPAVIGWGQHSPKQTHQNWWKSVRTWNSDHLTVRQDSTRPSTVWHLDSLFYHHGYLYFLTPLHLDFFWNFTKIKHIKHEAVDYFTIYFISWLVITPCQVWLRLPPTRCWRSVLLTQWEEKNCIWKF